MNILIIPSWYPNEDEPLSGCFFKEQAIALAKRGHHVVVLNASLQSRKNITSSLNFKLRTVSYDGVTEYAYNIPALGVWSRPILCSRLFYHSLKKIWRYARTKEPVIDLIHFHSYYPAGYGAVKMAEELNVPLIYTEHVGGIIHENLSQKDMQLLQNAFGHADKIIAVGNKLRNSMAEKYGLKSKVITVLPNMVNEELFCRARKDDTFPVSFLTVAHFDDNKRVDWIIKAFAHVFASNMNVRLDIIGGGERAAEFEDLIESLNMQQQISLKGVCSREKVAEYMKKANFFVLDSKVETFGVVYIEALACGTPVIIPQWYSDNIHANEKNSILIQENTLKSLEEALEQAYENRNNFDSDDISKECLNRYSGKIIAAELTQIYNSVVKG